MLMGEAQTFDVVIIGGGPAAGTAAILLATAGRRVAVIEKATFPRFRIGESLLPASNRLLKRLGVWDALLAQNYVRKYGAEFLDAEDRYHVHNVFANGWLPVDAHTFQVERARFDALLLDHARAQGAMVAHGVAVRQVTFADNGQRVHLSDGRTLRCGKVIDSSGRDSVLGRQLRVGFDTLPYPPKIAVYGHFEAVPRALGDSGGNIIIVRLKDGWFWNIPLDDTKTSVGVVAPVADYKAAGLDAAAWFDHCCALSPVMAQRMRAARLLGAMHTTADYSFQRTTFAGDQHFLAGDAAAFIDPIFSSGVCLAMGEAEWVADYLQSAAHCWQPIPPHVQRQYTREWKRRVLTMRRLIEVFYDPAGSAVFLKPSNKLRLFDALNSVIAGFTQLPWPVRLRYQLFLGIVALNKRWRFAGTIDALG